MKIAFFSTQPYDRQYFDRHNKDQDLNYIEASLTLQTVNLAMECEGVCVFVNDVLNEPVIQALAEKSVRLIALRCAGFNNVDLVAARKRGIRVVRVPAYSPHAVAEHAVALILTLDRKTHKAYNRVREGNFSLDRLTGFDLYGKTVGVIGTGKIGTVFARIMLGFGCQVMAYDVMKNPELEELGVPYLGLQELFSKSDILSLHCPLNDETRHLVNATSLSWMKKGAMLINTGRGALINTMSVIRSLKEGHLGYLGIDVYEQEEQLFFRNLSEEIIQDDQIMRLMSFPNVLITAHQAFFTAEALSQIAEVTLDNIKEVEKNLPCKNEIL